MKVGVLTFIHTRNFGANLQCFALQHTISSLGIDVEVINLYRPVDKGYVPCRADKRRFGALYSYSSLKDYRQRFNKVIVSLINKLKPKKVKTQVDRFKVFQCDYLKFSNEVYYNFTQLYERFPDSKYTHLVVGSDQVWNYASGFSKEPYFLTFARSPRKIAYAASLGHTTIPKSVASLYKKWLDDFAAVSVREDSASTLFSDLLNKNVIQTLDPTLLLNKQDWLNALSLKDSGEGDYVLVYMLSVSASVIELAKKAADILSCSVKIITSRPIMGNLYNCEVLRNEDPKSFVECYSRARFVVTNSFHGTAFAINFNIPFITVQNNESRLNTRKESLMNLLKLADRNIPENNDIDIKKYLKCDFAESNIILERERNKSFEFLMQALEK